MPTVDGTYYAVGASDAEDGPKYPIRNCADATDAWNLRNHGDYDISQKALERRIRRRAATMGCDLPDTAEEE